MKIYTRYLLKPYFSMLSLLTPVIIGIYLLIEFFDKLDNVTNAGLPFTFLFKYLVFKIPQIAFDTWPILISLSGLLAMAYLARGGELLAFRSLGFSSLKLALPYLLTALILTAGFTGLEEKILPESTYHAIYLWAVKVQKKEPRGLLVKGKLFFRGVKSFFIGRALDPDASYLQDVIYTKVNQEGQPIFIVWAKEAQYQAGHWVFKNGLYKDRKDGFVPKWFREKVLPLEFSPSTVLVVKRIPRAQHLRDLLIQHSFLKKARLPTTQADSEIAYRLLYPFIGPVLSAMSLFVLLGQRGRHALGKGVSLGVLAILLGLAGFMFLKGVGDTGRLSPLLALPSGLLVLILVALILFWLFRF